MSSIFSVIYNAVFGAKAQVEIQPESHRSESNPLNSQTSELKTKAIEEFEKIRAGGISDLNLKRLKEFVRLCPETQKTDAMQRVIIAWEKHNILATAVIYDTRTYESYEEEARKCKETHTISIQSVEMVNPGSKLVRRV